jgi:hypothetical protein
MLVALSEDSQTKRSWLDSKTKASLLNWGLFLAITAGTLSCIYLAMLAKSERADAATLAADITNHHCISSYNELPMDKDLCGYQIPDDYCTTLSVNTTSSLYNTGNYNCLNHCLKACDLLENAMLDIVLLVLGATITSLPLMFKFCSHTPGEEQEEQREEEAEKSLTDSLTREWQNSPFSQKKGAGPYQHIDGTAPQTIHSFPSV